MSELTQASHQWATRPADERYTSLDDMLAHFRTQRTNSRATVVPSRKIQAVPEADHQGIRIEGPNGHAYAPTHWSFGQLATLADAPAGYMRKLPAELAADCINYGLQVRRDVEDVGVLLHRNGEDVLRAATGPQYGRVWNSDIVQGLSDRFGDGVTGAWRVPGEFGKAVDVTKANTTLYASDRDMFVFLADEERRIEVPNRRDGQTGSMARGFFVWNSEVGAATLGISTFLFDYVCCNRIVWGAENVKEIRIRHTSSAPVRWLDEITPALRTYANSSAAGIQEAIAATQADSMGDRLDSFLAQRFGKNMVGRIKAVHELEEGRPIETRWDVITGATALARGIEHQDSRVDLERQAGALLTAA